MGLQRVGSDWSDWAHMHQLGSIHLTKRLCHVDESYLGMRARSSHRFCCLRLLPFTHVDKSHSTCWIGKTPRLWEERGWPSSQRCWITNLDSGLLGVIENCFYYSSLEAQITKKVGIGLDINYIPEIVRTFDLGMSPRHTVMNSWALLRSLFKSQISPESLPELQLHLSITSLWFLFGFFTIYELYMVICHAEFIPNSFQNDFLYYWGWKTLLRLLKFWIKTINSISYMYLCEIWKVRSLFCCSSWDVGFFCSRVPGSTHCFPECGKAVLLKGQLKRLLDHGIIRQWCVLGISGPGVDFLTVAGAEALLVSRLILKRLSMFCYHFNVC